MSRVRTLLALVASLVLVSASPMARGIAHADDVPPIAAGADPNAPVEDAPPADPHAGMGLAPDLRGDVEDPHGDVEDPHAGVEDPHAGMAGDPHAGMAGDPHDHGGDPHGGGDVHGRLERAFRPPELAEAQPNALLPAGTIRILVRDVQGAPVADADVQLGVLAQGGDRERTPARTNPDGVAIYSALATGTRQAYRVNVVAHGATFSTAPFQLPDDVGYEAHVRISPTTRDDRRVLLTLGQTFVELRDERLHIIQQSQLTNLDDATFVFPEDGLRVRLPEGFLAFQSQPVMTDQRVDEVSGQGFRIRGSLPLGTVTLTWAFDVPVHDTDMRVTVANPFRVFRYRVIASAPPGLSLDVEGMPPTRRFEDQGSAFLGTEIQRSPEEAPLGSLVLHLRGIPGPGPARWVAVTVAGLLLAVGAFFAFRPARVVDAAARSRELELRQKALEDEARELETERERGDVGPEYYARRRGELVKELATVLMQAKS